MTWLRSSDIVSSSGRSVDEISSTRSCGFLFVGIVARRKIREAARYSDFVTLKDAGVALDRLHERAGLALLGSAALAETAAAQSVAEFIDGSGGCGEIM